MPKKQKSQHPYETEREIFPTRLREIMEERGVNQTSLAEKIKASGAILQRQSISQYTQGQSNPDTSRLTMLCEALNVSSDYLLGLSHIKTRDLKVRAICEYTGLSEESVAFLHQAQSWREAADRNDEFAENLKTINCANRILEDAYRRMTWDEYGEPTGVSTLFSMMEDYISLHAAEDNPEKFRLETGASTLVLGPEKVTELALYVEMESIERKLQAMREENQGGKKDG